MTSGVGTVTFDPTTPIQTENDLYLLLIDLMTSFNKGSATDEENSRIFSALNFNFEAFKNNPPLMSFALYTYGRCIYGKDYKLAAITLRLSLEWQIEKGTQFLHYNSFADMEREPFDFAKIDHLLAKVERPDMELIQTLKWYAFACMNSKEVGNALYLERFQNLYAKIRTFCAFINTKDSVWEIGQIIYNSIPLCEWKKPGDIEAQIEWIKDAERSLIIEGDTARARIFQAQLFCMEAKLLSLMPVNETLFQRQLLLTRRLYRAAQETPNFDPFLKLKFLNDLATTLHKAFLGRREGISKDEILALFKQLVQEVLDARNPHESHALYLKNAAYFESSIGHFDQSILLYKKAAEIAIICRKPDEAAQLYRSAAFIAQDQNNHKLAKELYEIASKLEGPFV